MSVAWIALVVVTGEGLVAVLGEWQRALTVMMTMIAVSSWLLANVQEQLSCRGSLDGWELCRAEVT